MNEMDQNVLELVNFFEQRKNMARKGAQMAQPRSVRPGSAGKLLPMDGCFDGTTMSQMQAIQQSFQQNPVPATPQKQARHGGKDLPLRRLEPQLICPGIPITPQSMRRSRAPQALSIPHPNSFSSQPAVYAPNASLSSSPTFPQFLPGSADRASFPCLESPQPQASMPSMCFSSGHTRNNSTISLASSIGSTNALFFPESGAAFLDGSVSYAIQGTTPPVSPKKRKSPSKSPTKGRDRPSFLDKAIMRDTGVTQEQINTYIGDPIAADPRNWRCLWDGCTHVAARKENIRAHVQTHLGDRPYECPDCHADFVRSHDFTRHYTTHVDSRDFRCPDCPQAFNRADALQRHRDRDFCNGPPPDSPSKVRRTMDAIDKKKDTVSRRSKKQAARKRNTRRQDSVEISDDFWSSSAGSPEYFTSDAGSPEMILDTIMETGPSVNSSQQMYLQAEATNLSANEMKHGEDALERIFAALSEGASSPEHSLSLSPPMSPEQSHQTLTPFSPTPKRSDRKRHEMTPPASRDSMLAFLNAPSIHGNQTVCSAPSLPDLSSTSTSPLAFEPVTDFEEFCNNVDSANGHSWLDPQFGKTSAENSFDFCDLMNPEAPPPSWLDTNEQLFQTL